MLEVDPSSPGPLGSERFSWILHWSTWSFNAFTSSMSPGTLKIQHSMSVTLSGHQRDLYLYHYRFSLPCGKSIPHVHPVGFKCGLVAEPTLLFVCSTSSEQNKQTNKKKQTKHNITKQHTVHCSEKSPCRSAASQGDPFIVHWAKGNAFLNKSRCYRIKSAGEKPAQTQS